MPWPRFAVANAAAVCRATTLAMLARPAGAALLAVGGLALGAVTIVAARWVAGSGPPTPGGRS